jgi:hypothetical protein
LLPPRLDLAHVTRENSTSPNASALATRDHEVIRDWAVHRQAQPATGETTASGQASELSIVDGGAGLRFNFPGIALFRPIEWGEWLDHFDRHELLFVFDNADGPNGPSGPVGAPSNRYRLVKAADWAGAPG